MFKSLVLEARKWQSDSRARVCLVVLGVARGWHYCFVSLLIRQLQALKQYRYYLHVGLLCGVRQQQQL